ncbi:hypothetical protein RDWZM_004254 [Blomia tropicalis]|uniref:Uncharacterized protein n=1 Tax=Blomia tropicalis TaxID=40697 RepID=A0A9Q0MHQ3_BLOTA|nr:hypothetical protein BLOT_016586 [Blomia tropicalis]KAJ6225709.1 hypothetical protein RDWZM_004254 [Blomia tropicalis]
MRLPSGTRICLLAAFGFLLITTEFPEFSRIGQGDRKLANNEDGKVSETYHDMRIAHGYIGGGDGGGQSSILVEAILYKKKKGGWGGGYKKGGYGGGYGGGYKKGGWGGGYKKGGWGGGHGGGFKKGGYKKHKKCCYGK